MALKHTGPGADSRSKALCSCGHSLDQHRERVDSTDARAGTYFGCDLCTCFGFEQWPNSPDGKVMCQLCFDRFEIKDLSDDFTGAPVDVCKACAAAESKRAMDKGKSAPEAHGG